MNAAIGNNIDKSQARHKGYILFISIYIMFKNRLIYSSMTHFGGKTIQKY